MELQWIDVRDLCPWIVELARGEPGGIFNATGPASPATWGQVLQELTRLAAQPTSLRWSTVEVLRQSGIELPLVRAGSTAHFVNTAALAAGLDLRSLADTAAAALAWWRSQTEARRAPAKGWPTASQEEAALRLLDGAESSGDATPDA